MRKIYQKMKKISILGSGAWGTAIANVLADNGNEVIMYTNSEQVLFDININHKNCKYFKDNMINNSIKAISNIDLITKNIDVLIIAVPSNVVKELLNVIKNNIMDRTIIVNLSKGFDIDTKKTLSQSIISLLPYQLRNNLVTLVGPSFAEEVINRKITVVTATSNNYELAKKVQEIFSNNYFRVYTNNDVIGTEYCAALKNVIALACGMLDAIDGGDNARAALITRGMNEIKRYVTLFGGNEKTCLGLSGYGDLILTCTSKKSRNYQAGFKIGKIGYKDFIKNNETTIEGISACKVAYKISVDNNIYAPIVTAVYKILEEDSLPTYEIKKMMSSELKSE